MVKEWWDSNSLPARARRRSVHALQKAKGYIMIIIIHIIIVMIRIMKIIVIIITIIIIVVIFIIVFYC